MLSSFKICCTHTRCFSPADFDFISEKAFHFIRLAQGDASLLHILDPYCINHFIPEVPAEGPFIAQESSRDQTVTKETHTPLL